MNKTLLACVALAAACACSGQVTPLAPVSPAPLVPGPLGSYVKHVVVIVQENRSFENLFAGWPGADAPMVGYERVGGRRVQIPLHAVSLTAATDICHLWGDAMTAWHGGAMDGFNLERSSQGGGLCLSKPIGDFPYAYLDRSQIAPYRAMASQYVLADRMFPTEFGTSFTAHQDLIAGTTRIDAQHSLVNTPDSFPWGCDASRTTPPTKTSLIDRQRKVTTDGPFPCFTQYATIADTLDERHVSWRYYAPPLGTLGGSVWTAFDAIDKVRYGPDWANVVTPETAVLKDIAAEKLAGVSWVIPDLQWADYPAENTDYGPSWVGDIVDAIGRSAYWKNTAIVVLWDDWGGWYDDAPPPQLDYVGLAIRVPCIIVSPYARRGYVSHTRYEYGSILKFIEEAFGLRSLGSTDRRAHSLIDAFDFTQAPRPFVDIPTKYPASLFFELPQSRRPPDND
ncbi:MAG TPA: alkaline phosphatase family protein [Verrucomicrobiae bacterium]|nr:alkaline phosphatase family protein [Verrucomicrobiae bacterium]